MSEQTPGPWRIGDAGHTVFGPPNGQPAPEIVATLGRNFRGNGRLIKAAPSLLRQLEDTTPYVVEHAQRCNDDRCAHHATAAANDAAIKEVRGG